MIEIIETCEQGTPEWDAYRLGSIGGSSISKVCAKGQGSTRKTFLDHMAGELLSGIKYKGRSTEDMENGTEREPDARNLYALMKDADVRQVALIRSEPYKHISPDGLVFAEGMIEVKSPTPGVHARTVFEGRVPPKHWPQIQWGLSISARLWCDFVSYCPMIVDRPIFIVRAHRDEKLIAEMHQEANQFIKEMLAIVEKVKNP